MAALHFNWMWQKKKQDRTQHKTASDKLGENTPGDSSALPSHQQQKQQSIDNVANGFKNRNYSRHYHNGYHNQKNHHYNNGSSYYRSSYSNRNDSLNSNDNLGYQYSSDAKTNRSSAVNVNEDEYTKISTPRQDVLFKKGYLSKPKVSTVAEASTSSINGCDATTTTSGSVSTAESVTSDGTYYTDFPGYPPAFPCFGYYDKNGILVMSGFAVDNNGNSYPNGGQTYIYPPNYHCQTTMYDGGTLEHDPQMQPSLLESPPPISDIPASELSNGGDNLNLKDEAAPISAPVEAAPLLDDTDNSALDTTIGEKEEMFNESFEQQMLQPVPNFYDYAQFYNAFYYPGCIMAPLPIFEDAFYDEPDDTTLEANPGNMLDNAGAIDDVWEMCMEKTQTQTEQQITNVAEQVESQESRKHPQINDQPVPSVESPKPATSARAGDTDSKHPVSKKPPPGKRPPQAGSNGVRKKKELIESTLAFAEQNINLTKQLAPSQSSRQLSWKVVRNGKEVCLDEEDPEPVVLETRKECISAERSPVVIKVDRESVLTETTSQASSSVRSKKEIVDRKSKKTAKGKAKKTKKSIKDQQLQGFEVTEPDFSKLNSARSDIDQTFSDDETNNPPIELCEQEQQSNTCESNNRTEEDIGSSQRLEMEESNSPPHVDSEPFIVTMNDVVHERDMPSTEELNEHERIDVAEAEPEPAAEESVSSIISFDKDTRDIHECPPTMGGSDQIGDQSSGEEFSDNVDSGVQSPTTFCTLSCDEKENKSALCSFSQNNDGHVTDAVTKWLSDSLNNKRVEELFVLPEDPELLKRIYLFNFMNLDETLGVHSECNSSGTFSSDEAEDADSDYMSDVQLRNQKTEPKIDQLHQQTANGYRNNDHSNPKQKRCIIM
ncbi:uncharacterized protein LOC129743507 [Uranotaenia lowii]|uniref:uncharacterized protein LOC129743507 n=1 Tax=Uranotaenia lowii TaxID=190385 RepID=UPI002479F1F2|nr:uncharacterized protein LOC129743507 [Uranotaenia lowii]